MRSLIWRAFAIAIAAEQAGQRFSAFIAYGLGIWLGFQSFVNMGVNMGILPTKGLTLPLNELRRQQHDDYVLRDCPFV